MRINKLLLKNFKGISDYTEVEIKPITILIGGNSSGKSSVIHSLASMAQTTKLTNNQRPLTLDDEFASVHLGRFIEVIHSKSYADSIDIGFELHGVSIPTMGEKNNVNFIEKNVINTYEFKSTIRTQEIFLNTCTLKCDTSNYHCRVIKNTKKYNIFLNDQLLLTGATLQSGFYFDVFSMFQLKGDVSPNQIYPLVSSQQSLSGLLKNTSYLGPFRLSPLRKYPTRGANPNEVGSQGEATTTMLANEIIQSRSRCHISQIADWLKMLGLGIKLDVSRLASSDLFGVNVTLSDNKSFPIADLGYGISQVLPVLTQCSFSHKNSILLFEQPEIHLHINAARQLAKVFVDTIKQKENCIIAETHSPEFFTQFLREIEEDRLKRDDFIAYKVYRENGKSIFEKCEIEPDGDIYTFWEKGISR